MVFDISLHDVPPASLFIYIPSLAKHESQVIEIYDLSQDYSLLKLNATQYTCNKSVRADLGETYIQRAFVSCSAFVSCFWWRRNDLHVTFTTNTNLNSYPFRLYGTYST